MNLQNGFMPTSILPPLLQPAPQLTMLQRSETTEMIQRGDVASALQLLTRSAGGDSPDITSQLQAAIENINRGVTTGMTAFPVRENLDAEVTVLVPDATPVRNMLPRIADIGGTAVNWRQNSSLGGGWGSSFDQPGGGSAAQVFYAQDGAPAELTSVYANRVASFKLMGQRGSVTGFAMAAGRNFMDQYNRERSNAIMNLMLLEEHALINGSASSTAAPWGDGTTAFGFDGLINLIATGNGTPSGQIQGTVGALTFAHIDAQLNRIWTRGGSRMFMLINQQEAQSIRNLASASGTMHRIVTEVGNKAAVGLAITGYIHTLSGENVEIIVSRFVPAGTMVFGSRSNAKSQPTAEVRVLPQVQLPELAPNTPAQGYVLQEIAPAWASPQVYGFIVSCFQTLAMKDATVFGKSTGVTAV